MSGEDGLRKFQTAGSGHSGVIQHRKDKEVSSANLQGRTGILLTRCACFALLGRPRDPYLIASTHLKSTGVSDGECEQNH